VTNDLRPPCSPTTMIVARRLELSLISYKPFVNPFGGREQPATSRVMDPEHFRAISHGIYT